MRPALPPRHTVLAAALATASLASLPGAAWAGAGKSVVEGNAGATRAKASIELEMPVPHPLVNVRYRTVDGTATAGRDYVPTSGSVTFGPLDTEKEIRVDVLGDTLYEGDETFYLDTDSATSGDESESRRITIVDDDPAPSVSVSDTTVAEGSGSARFDVSLSAPSGLATTVAYSTADGTATAGSDYVAKVALSRTARLRLAHRGRLALAARFADGSVSRFVVRAARRH